MTEYDLVLKHPVTEEMVGITNDRKVYLAGDGSFSNSGWDIYQINDSDYCLYVQWSKYQGEPTTYRLLTRADTIQKLIDKLETKHQGRLVQALRQLDVPIKQL